MFDNLHSMFIDEGLKKVGCIIYALANVMDLLEVEFDENKEKKNQAIDALIEILNREKSV